MDEFGWTFHAVHPEAGVVSYVSAYENVPVNNSTAYRREPVMYGNTSMERWAAMEGNDKAVKRIGALIREQFGNETARNVSVTVDSAEGHEYRIELHVPSGNTTLTKEKLRRVVPDEVRATVHYPEQSVTVVMPVVVQDAISIGFGTEDKMNKSTELDNEKRNEPSPLSSLIKTIQHFISWLLPW